MALFNGGIKGAHRGRGKIDDWMTEWLNEWVNGWNKGGHVWTEENQASWPTDCDESTAMPWAIAYIYLPKFVV